MNQEKKHKIKMKIVTSINLLVAILFAYLVFESEITTYIVKSHSMIYATIDERNINSNDDGSDNYDYSYSYTVSGKKYMKKEYDTPLNYKVGEKAKICYKNSDPDDCKLYDGRISKIICILLYGVTSIYLFIHSSELKEEHTVTINGETYSGDSKEAMIKRMKEAKARRDMNNK
jgi:hypothetical protein